MENFQLLRTNILLGGQVKWDLVLDSFSDRLIVTDFHLTPVSDNSTHYFLTEENLLNYSHQENLKSFYNRTQGEFYSNCIDNRLSHDWVLIDDNKSHEIVYDDSIEAGNKLAKYSKYKKSLEVFCPVWLEDMLDGDRVKTLSFNITAYYTVDGTEKKLCGKQICFNKSMTSYFENYIKHIKPDDTLLEIDLYNKTSYVTGLKIDSGDIVKLPVPELAYNILHRDRPMMEFDAMLINNFQNNKLIARQLFNFNLCFDIKDLLSGYLANMVYGSELRFVVDVFVDGKKLEIRDFYSNYEYIQKTDIDIIGLFDETPEHKSNVLDYLYDYKCIDLVNKNKYIQNIIHWSLFDNPDYIFNLYNGFGPISGGNVISHYYKNSPDLLSKNYDPYTNGIGWVNIRRISRQDWERLLDIKSDDYHVAESLASNIMKSWINNVKYDDVNWNDVRLEIYNNPTAFWYDWNSYDLMILLADDLNSIINDIDNYTHIIQYTKLDDIYYIKVRLDDDFFVLLTDTNNADKLTFTSFHEILNNIELTDPRLVYLKHKMNNVNQIPLVSIDKTLHVVTANSPSSATDEIEYYKDDLWNPNYLLRYDGKIKPTFITYEDSHDNQMNYSYFKVYMSEEDYKKDEFSKFSKSGLPPCYPSIQYSALNKCGIVYKKWSSTIPIYISNININMRSRSDNEEYTSIKQMILYYLSMLYQVDDTNLSKLESIYNMYDIEYSYDYISPDNIDEYMYNIDLVLK